MPSVLGVLEERERAALARAEELRVELERLRLVVAEAEEAARRAVIAREEVVDALAGMADKVVVPQGPAVGPVSAPGVGCVGPRVEVPLWREGLGLEVLPPDCARIVSLVEGGAGGGGVRARQMREALGWEATDSRDQAARFRAKRLVERGWLSEEGPGLFRPRPERVG
jgi:hypothetical protein